jgi:hypothetical protein
MKDIVTDKELRRAIYLKVKNDYGFDLTEDEITLCIIEQEQQKLSLFHDQIYPNRRKISKWNESPEVYRVTWDKTIDGWRAIAQRSGVFAGIDSPTHIQSPGAELPMETRVAVYRLMPNGYRAPFVGVARYDESVQMTFDKKEKKMRPNKIWQTRPFMQCAVRAEVNALRMAFQDLGDAHRDAAKLLRGHAVGSVAVQEGEPTGQPADVVPEIPAEAKEEATAEVIEESEFIEPMETDTGPIHTIGIGDPIGEGDRIKMLAPMKNSDHDMATGESGAIYRVYHDGRVDLHAPAPRRENPEKAAAAKAAAERIKPLLRQYLGSNKDVVASLNAMGGVSLTNIYIHMFDKKPDAIEVEHIQRISEEIYKQMDGTA